MSITVDPTIAVAGTAVSPALGSGLIAVDRLSVVWGRADTLALPEPATATVSLFDPIGTWATGQELLGAPVLLGWRDRADPGSSGLFFRGRVLAAQVAPLRAGGVAGARVDLQCASLLADLANITPAAAWPAESYPARRARIAAAAAPIVSGIPSTGEIGVTVAPVDAEDQANLLEHLGTLFSTHGGQSYSYSPTTQQVIPVQRRNYNYTQPPAAPQFVGLAGLTRDPGGPAYVAAYPVLIPSAKPSNPGLWPALDARSLDYDPAEGIRRGAAQLITSVEATWADAADAYNEKTQPGAVPGRDAAATGPRVARIDTWRTDVNSAVAVAFEFARRAAWEGRAWQTQPLTLRTGTFPGLAHVQALLAGYETEHLWFLQRSWLPRFGVRPVVGVMGQTIGYADGRWELASIPAPVTTEDLPQHAISWDQIDDGSTGNRLRWHLDGAEHPDSVARSVTYGDMAHVSTGLGVTTVPTSDRWDVPRA